jgi:TolB-like protein/thioredoxin-like negative regulator of GroEL
VVLAVILLGFPLALVFAWIFDLSPQGIVRTEPLSLAEHHHRLNIPAIVEFLLICVLVVTVGYLYVERLSLQKVMLELESAVQDQPVPDQPAAPDPLQYRAIAVLPFADMSEAGDQAWFAEGIAEELLIALSQVDDLNVMARTSAFAFKGTDKTIAEIADILGVQAVLEGSVRRSGDRVRITAQLVDAKSGYHIWSGSYERQLTDIFALQDELARGVVEVLRVELGVESIEPLVAEQTKSLEAYNWFMRGRASFDWDSPENLDLSVSYFEKAVAADDDYAMAWGYLASARSLLILWRPFDDVEPGITAAYERALALDSQQSAALSAKAVNTLITQHDWDAAGILYRRAMAVPENSVAMTTYASFYLGAIDQLPQATQLFAEAEKRDPLHAGYKASHAMLLALAGDAQAAIQKAQSALELKPKHIFALMALADGHIEIGDYSAALDVVERLPMALQQDPRFSARAARCFASRGDYVKARQIYRDIWDNPDLYHGMLQAVQLALSLDEVEEAIDLMERGVANNAWTHLFVRGRLRHHDALENHPRYLELLERIGLDDESVAALHKKLSFDQVMEKVNKNLQ